MDKYIHTVQQSLPSWDIQTCYKVMNALKQENKEKLLDLYSYYVNYKPRGVEQGGMSFDIDGDVITRWGRMSLNEPWYQVLYSKLGRKPTKRELLKFAEEELRYGRYNKYEHIPPDNSFIVNEAIIEMLTNVVKLQEGVNL